MLKFVELCFVFHRITHHFLTDSNFVIRPPILAVVGG